MDTLTDRQQAILDFVRQRVEAEGLPPTLAEIAAAFGFRQPRAAHKHLQALAAKGALELIPGKARGIRLPAMAAARSRSGREATLRLPLLGRVAAGQPIGADAGVERWLELDARLFRPRPDYLLRVQGDSMIEDGILDGDLIAVHRTPEARDGQTVVARLEGELTVKRLSTGPAGLRLLPRNPAHAPIEVDATTGDFAIEGLFVGLVRAG